MAGIDEHEFQEPAGSPSYSSGGGGGPRVALIAIAIGGVVVLAVIAYFIFSGRTSPSRASATATPAARTGNCFWTPSARPRSTC